MGVGVFRNVRRAPALGFFNAGKRIMKAAQYSAHGVPDEVVGIIDMPAAKPGAGEVLIDVLASPINPSDMLTITGLYGSLPKLPSVPGNEGIGRVAEIGADDKTVKPGDRVFLPLGCGTWREQVTVPGAGLFALPEGGDAVQLSMLMINPPTAHLMLDEFVELKEGDWVIQNAATSAVGGYLIRLAALRGIKTANIVRREALIAPLEKIGADAVLVDGPELADEVAKATGGAGIELGIDAIGGEATARLAGCLAEGGTVVNYGALSGEDCRLSPLLTIFRGISLRGFWLARWFGVASTGETMELYAKLMGYIIDGTLAAEVEGTYGLDKIGEALVRAGEGGRAGKIIITPST